MVDLEDVPLVGAVVASGGAVLDLFLSGGELLVSLGVMIFGDPAVMVTLLRYSESILTRIGVDVVPAAIIDQIISILVVAMFVNFAGGLIIKAARKQ